MRQQRDPIGRPRTAPADSKGLRIGVLIVAYNAVTTLAGVLRRIPADVWSNVSEVVVFDDASNDDTYELAVGYKALYDIPHLTVFKNQQNLGYGGNQKRGYEYLISKNFDIVVLLHGDGQYAPEILSDLYAPIVEGKADAVFGSRMMSQYGGALKGGMPLYKYVGNRILTWYENRSLHMDLTEFHSGYRAYNLRALRQIDFSHMTDDFHFDTEIIIKLQHQGFRITEVPIPTYYGDELCHVDGVRYAGNVVRAIQRYRKTVGSVERYPEFAEYFTHYPLKVGKYSSHYWFLRLAGSNHDLLDVGCGEGFFATFLAERENRVVGIDLLSKPALQSAMTEYIQADLDGGLGEAKNELRSSRFDKILLQDILEHLRRPEDLLHDCQDLLKPQGQILVSVPNIANLTVRIGLLFGKFQYSERGILDRTHLRFYTRSSARRMLMDAGFDIVEQHMTVIPVDVALRLDPQSKRARAVNYLLRAATRLFPTLLGYQCVFVARPRSQKVVAPAHLHTVPIAEKISEPAVAMRQV